MAYNHYQLYQQMDRQYKALLSDKKYYEDEELLYSFVNDFYELLYNNIHNILEPVKNIPENENCIRLYCKYAEKKLLPLCQKKVKILKEKSGTLESEKTIDYLNKWVELEDNVYALVAFRSLEHYAFYIERGNPKKVWQQTMDIFKGFFYYANKMILDKKIDLIRASYFPGAGKTYACNLICSFWYGYDINMTILRITYADDLCKSFTKQIEGIITSTQHKKVFPFFNKEPKDLFIEHSAYNLWFKGTPNTNFMATTREGQSTGKRADLIIIDDILKGSIEAYNIPLQQKIVNTYDTDWSSRGENDKQKMILAGTMWSRFDILNVVQQRDEEDGLLKQDDLFKYIQLNIDGRSVYVGVPALDYDTDETTCPLRYSTDYFRKKRDKMLDKALFQAVYQQKPEPPEDLIFDYKFLNTYTAETYPRQLLDGECDCKVMIDPNRKGFDYFVVVFMKRYFIEEKGEFSKWYLSDIICRQKPYKMIKDDVLYKLKKNRVSKISIEINTSAELPSYISDDLEDRGVYDTQISEVYSTQIKEVKIQNARQDMIEKIVYPAKNMYDNKSEMGIAMDMLTTYSINQKKDHDDVPDCIAMFTFENCGEGLENTIEILDNIRL